MQGDRHGVTAYRVDTATGALSPHGQPIEIRHRPVHLTLDANATHVLVAYNNPSGLSVHNLNADGTLGCEVKQPAPLDGGIYAHQIRVHPSNKMVVMVTRGNGPAPNRPEDPGALKIFSYKDGILTNRQSIAPERRIRISAAARRLPPDAAVHVPQPRAAEPAAGLSHRQRRVGRAEGAVHERHARQPGGEQAGADDWRDSRPSERPVRLHQQPRERHARSLDGKPVWEGGENTIGVYAIDQKTGEPVRIQNIDSGGMHARTFTLDADSALLVAANQNAVTKAGWHARPRVAGRVPYRGRRQAVVSAEIRRGDRAGE